MKEAWRRSTRSYPWAERSWSRRSRQGRWKFRGSQSPMGPSNTRDDHAGPGGRGTMYVVSWITQGLMVGGAGQGPVGGRWSRGDDAARSLLDLWNGVAGTVAALVPADLARSTPDPATDVGALGAHLAGPPGPGSLAARVTAARDDAARRLAGRTAGDRVLGAHCLALWVHAHDLAAALPAGPSPGRADPARHTPVAVEAARLVADLAPRLVERGSPAPRLVVRDATGSGRVVLDRALGEPAADTLEIEAQA